MVASLLGPLRLTRQHAPSRLLLPMCYAASLGGILTLVGTSTNLLVNSLMVGRGMPALQIFDLFPVGIVIVLGCGVTMLVAYPQHPEGTAAQRRSAVRLLPGSHGAQRLEARRAARSKPTACASWRTCS